MKDVRIGCSGWSYRGWRGRVYPPGLASTRWLAFYARTFDTVEVNATFYRLATPAAVRGWIAQTPDDFCFSVKASRYLTHVRHLVDVGEGIERFYAPLAPLREAERLGATLWQLPQTDRRDDDRLARWLDRLPPGRHALELRHESWFAEEVFALLRSRDVALVLGDHPQRSFQSEAATASWRYVRFHHGARGRRGNYSAAELETWAQRLHRWRATHELLVYFNNDWEAFAPRNALWLRERLAALAGDRRHRRPAGRSAMAG